MRKLLSKRSFYYQTYTSCLHKFSPKMSKQSRPNYNYLDTVYYSGRTFAQFDYIWILGLNTQYLSPVSFFCQYPVFLLSHADPFAVLLLQFQFTLNSFTWCLLLFHAVFNVNRTGGNLLFLFIHLRRKRTDSLLT